ncbi:MAG: hypothetical protein ABIO72_05655 [Patescibacteria group bacterium]
MKQRQTVHEIIAEHGPVETDLLYWLEHVAHWHALLVAVVMVVSLMYVFGSGSIVRAG